MPLHLLGKKSWNVYNQDNVDRVQRDEAAAEAREAAEEQAMQEADAQRRIRILRGEPADDEPPTREPSRNAALETAKEDRLGLDIKYADRDRKRKRLNGEDDTDRDMRYAKRMVEDRQVENEQRIVRTEKLDDGVELVDHTGHINLFPAKTNGPGRDEGRNRKDDNKSKSRKDREQDDVSVVRLSDATRHSRREKDSKAWYLSNKPSDDQVEQVQRDVWGNEDPKRRARDQARLNADDPLAAIMTGVKQVRKVEADRKKWKQRRETEIGSMREDDERYRKRRERRQNREARAEDTDNLEGFSLDAKGDRANQGQHHGHHSRRGSREHDGREISRR